MVKTGRFSTRLVVSVGLNVKIYVIDGLSSRQRFSRKNLKKYHMKYFVGVVFEFHLLPQLL